MGERNKRILLELLQQPGNKTCADCNMPGKQLLEIHCCFKLGIIV